VSVRIAIITESFPPDVNGVAHSVLRIAGQLMLRGHQPLVIAPEPVSPWPPADAALGYPVVRVPSVPMPGYPGFRLGLSARRVRAALARHRAELVHLASPFVLGASGCSAARQLGLPVVAVYQTDVPAYARLYGTGLVGQALSWQRLRRIHHRAARTLAPSTAAAADLQAHGIGRVWLWGRGVDTSRFAPARRDGALRQSLAPGGEMLAGYVGRLAPEKRVDLLAGVAALPGVRLVMVGSGPAEAAARRAMPAAVFLGQRQGDALAAIYASLDVFVHSGPHETFGQTLQEAAASGLPVVAPAAGGPIDLVDDGVTGFLVPPGDAGALAGAVARLAADPALRAAQGEAARARVLGRGWPVLCEELIGHYQAVLGPVTAPAAEVPA
jgi:phosphatidylinositol alpha 1,6-mannosyltransferase